MKKIFIALYCIAIVGLLLSKASAENLLEVPQKYQGVWKLIALSTDQGQTSQQGNLSAFCKVTAANVQKDDGGILSIKQIIQSDNYTAIHFNEIDIMWVIEPRSQGRILVHVIDKSDNMKETMQVIFFVSN